MELLLEYWFIWLPVIIVVISFVFLLCSKKKFKIIKDKVKNVDGTIFFERMYIYSKSLRTFVQLSSSVQNGKKEYFIRIDYSGNDWIYLETLQLKIDNDNAITLTDPSPSRNTTTSGNAVVVKEIVTFPLSLEVVEKLKKCTKIGFQYNTGKPVEIPQKGVIAINQFLSK